MNKARSVLDFVNELEEVNHHHVIEILRLENRNEELKQKYNDLLKIATKYLNVEELKEHTPL